MIDCKNLTCSKFQNQKVKQIFFSFIICLSCINDKDLLFFLVCPDWLPLFFFFFLFSFLSKCNSQHCLHPSSIWRDSNPRSHGRESSALTTRPVFLNPNYSATRFFSTTNNFIVFLKISQRVATHFKSSTTRYRVATRRLRNPALDHSFSLKSIMVQKINKIEF